VRPTPRGWQAILFGVFSLLVAWLIGTTQLYQLAYALTGILLVALVLGLVLFRGLRYARRVPAGERFIAGRPSHVELVVSNASRTRSPAVEMVDHLPERRLLAGPPIERLRQWTTWEPVLFARRGLYEFGPDLRRTIDPFGLLRFVRRFETYTKVMVYPKTFELKGFPLRGRSIATGARRSFVRRGDEFSDLREYRHGDDLRHIYWKGVARTGELIVKEFSHNAPQRHAVVLDLHAGIRALEVEDAVSAAGSVLRHLYRAGLPFRLLCSDKECNATTFGDDEAAYWRAMSLLTVAQADGDTDMGDLLAEKLREEREGLGEGVILILRSLGDNLLRSVQKLRAAGLSVIVVALAAHTYRAEGTLSRRAAAFSEDVRRLGLAGAEVRIIRRPGGVATFAGGQGWRAMGARGVV
jgi:uncharacterized protein (DUF58 family)